MKDYDDPSEQGGPVVHLVIGDPEMRMLTLMERVTGRANDAAITLREAIDMIDADDDANLPIKMRLNSVLGQLRAAIREADGA